MSISRNATKALAVAVVIVITWGLSNALAQAPAPASFGPQYIDFGGDTKGVLYMPDPAEYPDPTTAVLVLHRTSNYLNHTATQELPPRGFVVLGMNPHSDNNEAHVDHDERMPMDVRAGVEFLYDEVGMDRVVLFGHSGGSPTTSYYQAIAEEGLSVCRGPDKIVECPDDDRLVGPPADAIILAEPHQGLTVDRLRSFNPAVRNETNPGQLSANLNPYLEKNGYNPDGCSSYSEDFKQRYFEAQSRRMNRLIDKALAIKADMEAGTHFPADDDSFVAYRQESRLMNLDNTIDAQTLSPQKLLKDNGEIVTEIVHTVRPCNPQTREDDESYRTGSGLEVVVDVTVNSFLGANAIRSTNSMYDIDWCSSNNSTTCMVRHIEAPTLVAPASGHYFLRSSEEIYEESASLNKDFVALEGSTHGFGNCSRCDGAPYFNVRENFFDYIAKWMNTDFTPVSELP